MTPPPCPALSWRFFAGIDSSLLAAAVRAVPAKARGKMIALLGSLLPAAEDGVKVDDDYAMPVDDPDRRMFFDCVYRGKVARSAGGASPWAVMTRAAADPASCNAATLTSEARKVTGVFVQCFFATIERMKGRDELVPSLTTLMNTTETSELSPLIHALNGIDTPQSHSYLVRLLGRSNVPGWLKVEICQMLSGKNLASFQGELRDVIKAITARFTELTSRDFELVDAIQSLLTPITASEKGHKPAEDTAGRRGAQGFKPDELEKLPRTLIPGFEQLAPEVTRALRTAQLIFQTILQNETIEGIDISPSVDMQYKALEILFRMNFEESTLRLVQSGILQRKLDVIGYARPSKSMTDMFENYIGSLPVVRDIPGFSRFKLNKVLRTIAMFQAGRRFTLDSLKAFGIFFLVFGRKECRYGLANLFALNFKEDGELLEFFRNLHIFQDIRNRAVHEGLPIQATKSVEALWNLTASIINQAQKLKHI
jgi:hypothetical protein